MQLDRPAAVCRHTLLGDILLEDTMDDDEGGGEDSEGLCGEVELSVIIGLMTHPLPPACICVRNGC